MVLKRSFDRSNQIIETKIIASKKFNVVPDQAHLILTTNPNLVLRVFITLFNLQGARRPAKLRYDIMSFSFCQALFSSFFELFQCLHPQEPFDLLPPNLVEPGRALSSARLSYHLFFHLSSTFFRLSKSFSAPTVLNLWPALSQALGYLTRAAVFCLLIIFPKEHPYPIHFCTHLFAVWTIMFSLSHSDLNKHRAPS